MVTTRGTQLHCIVLCLPCRSAAGAPAVLWSTRASRLSPAEGGTGDKLTFRRESTVLILSESVYASTSRFQLRACYVTARDRSCPACQLQRSI